MRCDGGIFLERKEKKRKEKKRKEKDFFGCYRWVGFGMLSGGVTQFFSWAHSYIFVRRYKRFERGEGMKKRFFIQNLGGIRIVRGRVRERRGGRGRRQGQG